MSIPPNDGLRRVPVGSRSAAPSTRQVSDLTGAAPIRSSGRHIVVGGGHNQGSAPTSSPTNASVARSLLSSAFEGLSAGSSISTSGSHVPVGGRRGGSSLRRTGSAVSSAPLDAYRAGKEADDLETNKDSGLSQASTSGSHVPVGGRNGRTTSTRSGASYRPSLLGNRTRGEGGKEHVVVGSGANRRGEVRAPRPQFRGGVPSGDLFRPGEPGTRMHPLSSITVGRIYGLVLFLISLLTVLTIGLQVGAVLSLIGSLLNLITLMPTLSQAEEGTRLKICFLSSLVTFLGFMVLSPSIASIPTIPSYRMPTHIPGFFR